VVPGIVLAVSHQLNSRREDAVQTMNHVREHNDGLRRTRFERWHPFQRSEDADIFGALTKAGLPE
jgi:hypothetical protein